MRNLAKAIVWISKNPFKTILILCGIIALATTPAVYIMDLNAEPDTAGYVILFLWVPSVFVLTLGILSLFAFGIYEISERILSWAKKKLDQ